MSRRNDGTSQMVGEKSEYPAAARHEAERVAPKRSKAQ